MPLGPGRVGRVGVIGHPSRRSPIPSSSGHGVPLGEVAETRSGAAVIRRQWTRRPHPPPGLPRRARGRPAGSLTACLPRADRRLRPRRRVRRRPAVRRGRPDRRCRRAGPRAVARGPLAARGGGRARRDARRGRARERDRARVRGRAPPGPDRGRDERRRRQRRRAAPRGPERDRRHAPPLARPGRPERRARLLLTRRRHRRAGGLPPARAASRHARPARGVPQPGRRAVRRGLRAGPDAEPVHALQRGVPLRRPRRLRRAGRCRRALDRPLRTHRRDGTGSG